MRDIMIELIMVKYLVLFVVFFVIGFSAILGYRLVTTRTNEPITNIINNIAKPGFSIKDAPSDSVRGTIKEMSGDIGWVSRIATEAAKITSPQTLQQGEEIQTGETGTLVAEFPNESSIKILPKTQVDFVQTLPVDFVASIASGSATFTKLSDGPVSIRAMHLLIRQNSGEVNIGVDTDNSLVNINILSGSIRVAYNDLNLNSQVVDFSSGKRITFNDTTRRVE